MTRVLKMWVGACVCALVLLLSGCGDSVTDVTTDAVESIEVDQIADEIDPFDASYGISPASVQAAEVVISAFYSWNRDDLASAIGEAEGAVELLYYQGWAEAANYAVQERKDCVGAQMITVICEVIVTDDFGEALGYVANDTFRFVISDGQVASVSFEGDDPPVFMELFGWIGVNRPDVFSGPCLGMFDDGQTPGECARAVAGAAREFADVRSGEGG